MRAVDTNVLARFILDDDPAQAALAAKTLTEPFYISDTVLLEIGWLLSSRFGVNRADLAATLRDVVRLPAAVVSDTRMIEWAIGRFAVGADLADMIHLVSSRRADAFVSFEKQLARDAGPDAPLPIETLA